MCPVTRPNTHTSQHSHRYTLTHASTLVHDHTLTHVHTLTCICTLYDRPFRENSPVFYLTTMGSLLEHTLQIRTRHKYSVPNLMVKVKESSTGGYKLKVDSLPVWLFTRNCVIEGSGTCLSRSFPSVFSEVQRKWDDPGDGPEDIVILSLPEVRSLLHRTWPLSLSQYWQPLCPDFVSVLKLTGVWVLTGKTPERSSLPASLLVSVSERKTSLKRTTPGTSSPRCRKLSGPLKPCLSTRLAPSVAQKGLLTSGVTETTSWQEENRERETERQYICRPPDS